MTTGLRDQSQNSGTLIAQSWRTESQGGYGGGGTQQLQDPELDGAAGAELRLIWSANSGKSAASADSRARALRAMVAKAPSTLTASLAETSK